MGRITHEVASMTKGKHSGRKTSRIVRTPATRFGHLQKRLRKVGRGVTLKTKKQGRFD